ncbi:hypothetical protein G6O69_30190 [Pseudenhygromyxa sp. WMMC2535]|uniref:peptidase MA family metallohydrolase n=1 Tax=Pseudenhygromyxa sp. WMMC2535 TaxID=2712867 RepID=UPI001554CA12|nr:hypothetical protein [Pseudenhygromyxa sp. WMMC2535]NVB42131.1 hypothetical protein [Pseudenhygromyxa sp. WMMC2535]
MSPRPEPPTARSQSAPAAPKRLGLLALLALSGALALCLGRTEPTAQAAPPSTSATESAPESARETSEALAAFMRSVDAWDLEEASERLEDIADRSERDLAAGVLALYEARYEDAEVLLAGVIAAEAGARPKAGPSSSPVERRAQHFLDVARGAQLALGDARTLRSPDGRFEAVFADPKDELLAPYLFAAMATAYDRLGEDVGVRPEAPIRFEFYDEPGKLALVTPLTLENIYTTGTIGICKYRRIMMITPRVMLYGYGWLDTAVHEYVHYLLTMRTRNNAPVWMQEGMAKLMETRWREDPSGPLALEPPIRQLLHDALASGELVTLEQMHPSVAMLPSQELAALAYAEAQTMLGLLEEERGEAGMAKFMDQVGLGVDAKIAFANAWGGDFDAFFAHWREVMAARTKRGGNTGNLSALSFRGEDDEDAAVDPSLQGDVFSHLGGGQARQHARLGVLLTLRGHVEAAVIEYEKARAADRQAREDPKLGRRLGELYLQLDRPAEALPLLIAAAEDEPDNANVAAAEARARRLTGDLEGAAGALDRALRQNPFIPGLHCDLAAIAEAEGDAATATHEAALCGE